MSKPFITYTAQVEKLKNEKDLVITDDDFAVESLQNISYYALIGGYKHPFIDIHTRKYINEACFEDIVALYEFDEELRGIFFKYLCRVERKCVRPFLIISVKNMENVKKNILTPIITAIFQKIKMELLN